jgi:hypothetical protein
MTQEVEKGKETPLVTGVSFFFPRELRFRWAIGKSPAPFSLFFSLSANEDFSCVAQDLASWALLYLF